MTDVDVIKNRLRHFGEHIERWRAEATRLRDRAGSDTASSATDAESLVQVETTAGAIYDEIATFKETVLDIAATSPEAAGELAEVGEALHLLLLEITELGTQMYATRSGLEPAPGV